ncbi:MAG: heat-inducible transcriptional repressor HrcA [Candidatus Dormibacteraeota bacterium]|nr:heat-inducible transcriptional repressor HrcA [Candidatus Dormibacteraeota bacterium]
MPGLDDRKEQVLRAVVVDYTTTALPVGSQALAQRHFARWSSATIRNELAHLMETGHLRQPHTSSGRVPSDLGYRYFVDFLMEEGRVEPRLRDQLATYFDALPVDLEGILEGTAMCLARASDSVGVISAPRTSSSKLKYVNLVHLDGPRILALVVLEGNLVRQQPLELPEVTDQESLDGLSNRLNHDLKGQETETVERFGREGGLSGWQEAVVQGIGSVMTAYDEQSARVIVHDGVRNLVKQPEFLEPERLMPVLELLEESRTLARVMESLDPGEQLSVVIGDENPDNHLRDCTVVLTTYRAMGGVTGTMGTIGPTRIRYPEVVARVRYIAKLAGDSLGRLYA